LVANSTTAADVTPLSLSLQFDMAGARIPRVRLHKSGDTPTNAAFRVHLFKTAPGVPGNGDNGAFAPASYAGYLGAFDVAAMIAGKADAGCVGIGLPVTGQGSYLVLNQPKGGDVIYALLEARGAYTPVSAEVFTLSLELEPVG
jgi:hypothetical protein